MHEYKKEFSDELKRLKIKTKFDKNLVSCCSKLGETRDEAISYLNKQTSFIGFLTGAFNFDDTPEGKSFWEIIKNKSLKKDRNDNRQNRDSGESNRGYLSETSQE